jgi:Rrf2 family transcriptional regulator, nitric oxide-sensitive transcriptional repressor
MVYYFVEKAGDIVRLTVYTDYSLRTLLYLGIRGSDYLATIQEIADTYNISKNHLMKVTYDLGKLGYIETIRGRGGGIRLAVDPSSLTIGQVVRQTEDDFNIVECFDRENNMCIISPACKLKHVLYDAMQAYLNVLDQYTLADVAQNKDELLEYLKIK